MKQTCVFLLFFAPFFLMMVTSCQSDSTGNTNGLNAIKDSANYTSVLFPDSVQNFGMVEKGKQVKIVFHVKNVGAKPLLIADARPSCGCTIADFTKSAIAPGKEGEITGTFDSNHGMPGQIRKTITVTTNTSPTHNMLIFMGEVKPKADSTKTK